MSVFLWYLRGTIQTGHSIPVTKPESLSGYGYVLSSLVLVIVIVIDLSSLFFIAGDKNYSDNLKPGPTVFHRRNTIPPP